jgi:hypothetical protein
MKELFEELHKNLALELLERIKNGEAKPADLSVARQFLKDNGVDAYAAPDSPLQQLVDSLPFEFDEEVKH